MNPLGSIPQICNCMSCGKICCEMEVGVSCTFCGAPLPIAAGMGKKAVANVRVCVTCDV